jgi:hypothetical protein
MHRVASTAICCRYLTTSALGALVAALVLALPPAYAADDKPNKVERTANRAGKFVEKTATRSGKFVEKTAKRSAKFAEKTAKRAGNFVERTATKTENAVKRALD